MSRIAPLLVALFVLPAAAFAQSAPAQDRAAVTFNEIERGFFFGLQGGWLFMFEPPAAEGTDRPFSPGQMAFIEVGYEFGERVSIAGFLMGSANRASSTYIGFSNAQASGDFSSLIPGGTVRVNIVGFNDSQEVKRTWLYARGGAGYAMFWPKALIPEGDVLAFAGPGIEYFTKLRHFSIGLEVTGSLFLTTGAKAVTLTPNLRYAF